MAWIEVFGLNTTHREVYGVSIEKERTAKLFILEYLIQRVDTDGEFYAPLFALYAKYNTGSSIIPSSATSIGGYDPNITIVDMWAIFNAHLS
jgi:hypothetical protein